MRNFILHHINEIKTAAYLAFIGLNIDTDIVKVLMYLMLFDTVSGVLKSLALGLKFEFKILFFGLSSKILVLLIPMVLALVGKGISKTYDFSPILDSVLRVLVVAEGLSTISNFYVIKTRKEIKNIDIVTLLLSAIRKGMLSIIDSTLKKIENPTNNKEN